jgi:hypothetical protein
LKVLPRGRNGRKGTSNLTADGADLTEKRRSRVRQIPGAESFHVDGVLSIVKLVFSSNSSRLNLYDRRAGK